MNIVSFSLSYFLLSPAYTELAVLILISLHKKRKKIVIDTEPLVDRIKVNILSFHKQGEFFFVQNHLHKIRLDTTCVSKEVYVLILSRCVPYKPKIELTHSRVVVVQLGYYYLIYILEINTGR